MTRTDFHTSLRFRLEWSRMILSLFISLILMNHYNLDLFMTTPLLTPVLIIGAGPAGVGTSLFLSKFGIPHIILEKEIFPRDKVCGDACSGKTLFVLRKANPQWPLEIFQQSEKFCSSKGIIFVAPNGKAIPIPFGGPKKEGEDAAGFTTPRLILDHYLFQKIDRKLATVFEGVAIQSLERKDNGVVARFLKDGKEIEVLADIVVGADGDKGIVQKKLVTNKPPDKGYSVGLRAYYKGVSGMDKNNFIELHFLKEMLPGYFWIFPLPNGMANIGVGLPAEDVKNKKIKLRELMMDIIEQHPEIKERFKDASLEGKIQGWGLPLATGKNSISGERYILTGDAASLIDPFSGEGIGNALYSGMLAAEAIEKAIQEKRFDADFLKENYDEVLYKKIGQELKLSTTLQALCRYPWLFNFVVKVVILFPTYILNTQS